MCRIGSNQTCTGDPVWTHYYQPVGHYLTEDEYQEYQDLKKFKEEADKDVEEWDRGIIYFYKPYNWICPDCSTHVQKECIHYCHDQETLEDKGIGNFNLGDKMTIKEKLDFLCEWLEEQFMSQETTDDRMDDAECEIRQINKDLGDFKHTQKLINKIVQEQICEISANSDTSGSTTKPKQAKGKNVKGVK